MIGRFGRIALALWRATGRLTVLALILLMPRVSLAKPLSIDSGPTLDGDPTADDQPSPAPKGNKSARFIPQSQRYGTIGPVRIGTRASSVRLALEIYFRLFRNI
ncbi:MAG TPA: hypothetical protein VF363_00700 [Candidatus Eisenbacteria bacterium]